MYSTKSESRVADVTAVYHDKNRGGIVQDTKVPAPVPTFSISNPLSHLEVRDEDFMDLAPQEVPEAPIAEILTGSSISPLQRVGITGTPLCVVHVCPSRSKFAYLRFTHLVPSNKLSFPKGAFGNIKAPTYRDWETDRKSTRLNSSHRL